MTSRLIASLVFAVLLVGCDTAVDTPLPEGPGASPFSGNWIGGKTLTETDTAPSSVFMTTQIGGTSETLAAGNFTLSVSPCDASESCDPICVGGAAFEETVVDGQIEVAVRSEEGYPELQGRVQFAGLGTGDLTATLHVEAEGGVCNLSTSFPLDLIVID